MKSSQIIKNLTSIKYLTSCISKEDLSISLILFCITLGFHLPLYGTPYWRTPDAFEYISVAQNIVLNGELLQTIKWHFFDMSPVISSALYGKPVFTSIVFSGILRLSDNVHSLQLFGFFLASANTILYYWLARKFFQPSISFMAGLFIALNPNLLITHRMILSEPLFQFFVLLTLILYFQKSKSLLHHILIGLFSGLAYLTRSEGIFLFITLLVFSFKEKISIKYFTISFIAVSLPFWYFNFLLNGNPLYSYTVNHFRVFHFSEGMQEGYGKTFPSVAQFVTSHPIWIIQSVNQLFWENIKSIISFQFLGPLFAMYFFIRKKISRFLPLIILGSILVLNFSVFWSSFSEPERHLSTAYMLFLLPLLAITEYKNYKKAAVVLFVCMLLIYTIFSLHRIHWARSVEIPESKNELFHNRDVFEWIKNNTNREDIIASSHPGMMNIQTYRPSIILPNSILQNDLLTSFIMDYSVDFIVVERNAKLAIKKCGCELVSISSNHLIYHVKQQTNRRN